MEIQFSSEFCLSPLRPRCSSALDSAPGHGRLLALRRLAAAAAGEKGGAEAVRRREGRWAEAGGRPGVGLIFTFASLVPTQPLANSVRQSLSRVRLFAAPWNPPGPSVRGILQSRIPERVAVSSSGVLSTRGWNLGLLYLLPWQVDSWPLGHLGSPRQTLCFSNKYLLSEEKCEPGKVNRAIST